MRRPTATVPVRLTCALLAVVSGLAAAPILSTGELKARGGKARLDPAGRVAVGGVLVALLVVSSWVAVASRENR